jgi:LPS-assembly protein
MIIMFRNIILIFFFSIVAFNVNSKEIEFESKLIDIIKDREIMIASGEVNATIGDKFLKSDKIELNKITNIHVISGSVFFKDKSNNNIYSEKIIYDEKAEKYTSPYETTLVIDNLYKIKTKNLVYYNNKKVLVNDEETTISDDFGNNIFLNGFLYDIEKNFIKAKNVKIIDKNNNFYEIKAFLYDLDKKKFFGKDISINNDDKILSKNHVPRSKSRSLIGDDNFTILSKSSYTNCKKRDSCPPWLINAEKVTHDKKNKRINYDNAILKFYDFPIMYFPKFFHPDPSVKRQSGFLTPTLSSTKSSNYFNIPYYFAISDNSDLTFHSRIYDNLNNLYQAEYRKEMKNSSHVLDLGIKGKSPIPLFGETTGNHFFLNSNIVTNFDYFDDSNLDIEIERVSNDKYLKTYDVRSPIINSQSLLLSSLDFNGYNENLDFFISTKMYKDLTKTQTSDQYEYILPEFSLTKSLKTNLNGILEFQSSGYIKNFETNVYDKKLINNLTYVSSNLYSKNGFINNYQINLKNVNNDSKNSKVNKNKIENNLQGIAQYNLKFPLQKKNESHTKLFNPRLSLKYNPLRNKNISAIENTTNYDNIFSINRLALNDVLEGGRSLTLGSEYKLYNNNDLNDEIFGLNIATSLRDKKNDDLPSKSSLGNKNSNFFGNSRIKLNDFLNLDYDFITKNNLKDFDYHGIKSTLKINNFVTKFEFIEENNNFGNESYVSNESSIEINQNSSLLFRVRENKKTNIKEYYDWVYQYKMDCLTAGLKYRKSYYNDGLLKPEESINFSITFMPFDNTVNLPSIY